MAWPVDRRSKAYRYPRGRFFEVPYVPGRPGSSDILQPAIDGSRRPRVPVKRGRQFEFPHAVVLGAPNFYARQQIRSRPAVWLRPKRSEIWEFAHLPVFTLAVFPPSVISSRGKRFVRRSRGDIFDFWSVGTPVPTGRQRKTAQWPRRPHGDIFEYWQQSVPIAPTSRARRFVPRSKRGEFDEAFWSVTLPIIYPRQWIRRTSTRYARRPRGDVFDFWGIPTVLPQARTRVAKPVQKRGKWYEAFWALPPYYPTQWIRSRPGRSRTRRGSRADAFWTLPPYYPIQWIRSKPGHFNPRRGSRTDAFWTLPPYFPTQWIRNRFVRTSKRSRGVVFDFWTIASPPVWIRSRPATVRPKRSKQIEVLPLGFIPNWFRSRTRRQERKKSALYNVVPVIQVPTTWKPSPVQHSRTPRHKPRLFRRIWDAFWFKAPSIPSQSYEVFAGPFDYVATTDVQAFDATASGTYFNAIADPTDFDGSTTFYSLDASMSALNLNFSEGNDPVVTFTLKKRASNGTLTLRDLSVDLTAVELYIKANAELLDTDTGVIKYSSTGVSPAIVVIQPGSLAQINVTFSHTDIGVDNKFYHLDVVDGASRRITFAWGNIVVGEV